MTLALVFVGALVGYATVTGVEEPTRPLSKLPEFGVWAGVIAAQGGLWAVLVPTSFQTLRETWARYPVPRLKLSALHLVLALLVVVGLGLNAERWRPEVLDPYAPRIGLLTMIGFVVAWPAVVGMWSVGAALERVRSAVDQTSEAWSSLDARVVNHLVRLRAVLQRLLAILAAIAGALTVAAGAQRHAVVAWGKRYNVAVDFPAVGVVLYGLLFTALVALIYLPVYVRLESVGGAFVAKRFPVPSHEPAAEWYSGRDNLMALLKLGVRPAEAFQSGFIVLAPLAASLVSVVLPK